MTEYDDIDPWNDPAPPKSKEEERAEYVAAIRALADMLEANDALPLPTGHFSRHYPDADDFDAAAFAMGVDPSPPSGGYESATLTIGPLSYDIQTNGRAAQRIRRREEALAARERELGIA